MAPSIDAASHRVRRHCVRVLGALLVAASPLALGAQERERVGFGASVAPETVYVGQQVTYTLTVRIPSDIRQRLRRYPTFIPPEATGMLAYELPLARAVSTSDEAELHTFRRALFVLAPGRYGIPAARLQYTLPQSASFFSREEERTLRADGVRVVAIDPPVAGRPAEWRGAVGSWRASARIEPTTPRVGDPAVLTLRLEGEGNPTLLPRPTIAVQWGELVPDGERVVLEAAPLVMGGVKEFRWLLTPRDSGMQAVPALAYPYFDPLARAYVVARTATLPVRVRPGGIVPVMPRAVPAAAPLPIALRPLPRGTALSSRAADRWPVLLVVFLVLAPIPWSVAVIRRRGGRGDTAALGARTIGGRARGALAVGAQRRDAHAAAEWATSEQHSARRILDVGLRARLGIVAADHAAPGALAAALRVHGVTPETATEAESLRDACDALSFAPQSHHPGPAPQRMRSGAPVESRPPTNFTDPTARVMALLTRIGREAKARVVMGVLLALVVAGCTAPATPNPEGVQAFVEGEVAYRGADYRRATDAFARAAEAFAHAGVDRSAQRAAWANLGAAAWQAGDTGLAVVGWQRALRLDPRDAAVRDRLARVRAPQSTGAARVWPIPPWWVALCAALLWCAGWGMTTYARWTGARVRGARMTLLLAAAAAALGWHLDARLAARALAVITESSPLRTLPAFGADRGAVPLNGEVARIGERRGAWLWLVLDGGREGWYPADRTRALARD